MVDLVLIFSRCFIMTTELSRESVVESHLISFFFADWSVERVNDLRFNLGFEIVLVQNQLALDVFILIKMVEFSFEIEHLVLEKVHTGIEFDCRVISFEYNVVFDHLCDNFILKLEILIKNLNCFDVKEWSLTIS
jgi:hypothetical protein